MTATSNVKAQYTASDNTAGHRIKTPVAGALGAGAALPCYDCHDSHGSVNNALILDSASIEGTSSLAITTYNQAARPYNDKVLCAGCHDTNQATTTAGTRVEGLNPVDPLNSTLWGSVHVSAGVAAVIGA